MIGEDPLQEVLPQARIGEASLFFHRKVRIATEKGRGKQSGARLGREATSVIDPHPLQSATGRVLLEDVPAEFFLDQSSDALRGVSMHRLRVVGAALGHQQPELVAPAHQGQRLAARAKASGLSPFGKSAKMTRRMKEQHGGEIGKTTGL